MLRSEPELSWKDRVVAATLVLDTLLFTAALVAPLSQSAAVGWGYVVLLVTIAAVGLVLSFIAACFLIATTDDLAPRLIVGGLGLLLLLSGISTIGLRATSPAGFEPLWFAFCVGPALVLTAAIPKPTSDPDSRRPTPCG